MIDRGFAFGRAALCEPGISEPGLWEAGVWEAGVWEADLAPGHDGACATTNGRTRKVRSWRPNGRGAGSWRDAEPIDVAPLLHFQQAILDALRRMSAKRQKNHASRSACPRRRVARMLPLVRRSDETVFGVRRPCPTAPTQGRPRSRSAKVEDARNARGLDPADRHSGLQPREKKGHSDEQHRSRQRRL